MKKAKKILWKPSSTKFNLYQKSRLKRINFSKNSTKVCFGLLGFKAFQSRRISAKPLETSRRIITRIIRKKEFFWVRCTPNIPVTSKPLQIRMGKGKGNVEYWTYNLAAGTVIFELGATRIQKVRKIFRSLKHKLGVPLHIFKR